MTANTTLRRCSKCHTVTPLTWCPNPVCDGYVESLTSAEQQAYINGGHAALDHIHGAPGARCSDCGEVHGETDCPPPEWEMRAARRIR